jgi:RNA-directed DNA polymerase
MVRYADDFIITGKTKELLENEVKPLVEIFLAERGLTLSAEKTRITPIAEGFNFLGWNIRKYDGKLLIKPSKKNIKAFLEDIRATVKANKQAKQENLIRLLNPKITGWANYHRGAVAKESFTKVDHEIWKLLWQWAKRRHPQKGQRWIKDRYWMIKGSRDWVFSTETKGMNGQPETVTLVKAGDTKIRRHIKIRGEANPFDPQWETYFEERIGVKMPQSLKGRRRLLNLWREQDGNCPICNQKITELSGWHTHHLVWRSKGGSDGNANRVLVHPNCHRQIHSQKLEVAKPVLAREL